LGRSGDIAHLNYETDYQYDALNNLICAVQKGTDTTAFSNCASASATWRPRSFTYDSLSRLLTASNPESGSITYTYDLNSNLATKVEPKAGQTGTQQTTISYSYDVLNRLTKKGSVNPFYDPVHYAYDGTTGIGCSGPSLPFINSPKNLVGRRSGMCADQSASSWSYDQMGRPTIEARSNHGSVSKAYNTSYSYFKDGSLNLLTYPSGDVLTYNVGGAGRATSVKDSANSYVMPHFPCMGCAFVQQEYAPFGGLGAIYLGETATSGNIFLQQSYNSRLQLDVMAANANQKFLWRTYDFHPGTGDNGNLFGITDNVDSTRSTAFVYDPLNRIKQANTTTTTGANCWGETYTIDTWGNLTNRGGVSGMTGCSTEGLSSSASTRNQLGILTYDAAGNVTNDGNGNLPTYDAENRIATDAGVTYSYDADGFRMEKSSGTMYWPGPGGTLTESDLSGNINEEYIFFNGARIARVDRPSGTVHYYFSDDLGLPALSPTTVATCRNATSTIPTGEYSPPSAATRITTNSPAKNAIPNPASICSVLGTTPQRWAAS
jgi:YD repeat-containing protein